MAAVETPPEVQMLANDESDELPPPINNGTSDPLVVNGNGNGPQEEHDDGDSYYDADPLSPELPPPMDEHVKEGFSINNSQEFDDPIIISDDESDHCDQATTNSGTNAINVSLDSLNEALIGDNQTQNTTTVAGASANKTTVAISISDDEESHEVNGDEGADDGVDENIKRTESNGVIQQPTVQVEEVLEREQPGREKTPDGMDEGPVEETVDRRVSPRKKLNLDEKEESEPENRNPLRSYGARKRSVITHSVVTPAPRATRSQSAESRNSGITRSRSASPSKNQAQYNPSSSSLKESVKKSFTTYEELRLGKNLKNDKARQMALVELQHLLVDAPEPGMRKYPAEKGPYNCPHCEKEIIHFSALIKHIARGTCPNWDERRFKHIEGEPGKGTKKDYRDSAQIETPNLSDANVNTRRSNRSSAPRVNGDFFDSDLIEYGSLDDSEPEQSTKRRRTSSSSGSAGVARNKRATLRKINGDLSTPRGVELASTIHVATAIHTDTPRPKTTPPSTSFIKPLPQSSTPTKRGPGRPPKTPNVPVVATKSVSKKIGSSDEKRPSKAVRTLPTANISITDLSSSSNGPVVSSGVATVIHSTRDMHQSPKKSTMIYTETCRVTLINGTYKYMCDLCGEETFSEMDDLTDHKISRCPERKNYPSTDGVLRECPFCAKSFLTRSEFQNHLVTCEILGERRRQQLTT